MAQGIAHHPFDVIFAALFNNRLDGGGAAHPVQPSQSARA